MAYFRGIKAGDVTAWAADKNGVITFTSGDNSVVTVNADTKGVHINLKESFVNDVTTTKQGLADEILRATGVEDKIKADLGTKDSEKGSAFERISALENELDSLSGGAGSIQTQISNAISALDLPNTYEAKGEAAKAQAAAATDATNKANAAQSAAEATAAQALESAVGTLNTEINKKANSADVYVKNEVDTLVSGAKTYADGLVKDAQGNSRFDAAGAAAQALADAKSDAESKYQVKGNYETAGAAATAKSEAISAANEYTDGKVSEINGVNQALAGRVEVVEGAITVLNGDGDGSVNKKVADAIAGVVASAPEDFDTLKEVADWIANDTTGAAKMQADIAKLNGDATKEGSVAYQVNVEKQRAELAEQGLTTAINNVDEAYKAADTQVLADAKKYTNETIAGLDLANTYEEKGAAADALEAAKAHTATEIGKLSFDAAGTAEEKANEALGSAKAYADSLVMDGENPRFDAKGSASAAEAAAKSYADGLAKNYDAAGSAADAKSEAITESKNYTDQEVGKVNTRIDNLDYESAEGFVTKITQIDGKVSAAVATSIAAEKIAIADSADHFPASVANVEQALAFMANMLTWEEL